MTLNKKALGNKIKFIRKKKGITQQTLAEWTDCTPTHISYCETGRKNMSLETLVRIANALNVSTDELLMDSLENTIKVSNHEFASILADCSEYEKYILFDIMQASKASIRRHAGAVRTRPR